MLNNLNSERMKFTDKQIKAAKEVKEEVIHGTLYDWRHIYMAGEICMWDELQQKKVNGVEQSESTCNLQNVIDRFCALEDAMKLTLTKNIGKVSLINRFEELGKALGRETSL